MSIAHVLGFPRIGFNRELKFAMESFWSGKINEKSLLKIRKKICLLNWSIQIKSKMDYITVGDFTWYDHILNMLVLLGAIPTRFKFDSSKLNLNEYYIMARGNNNNLAMEMTKWFNTNYHYLVPEWTPDIKFKGNDNWLLKEISYAYKKSNKIKVVLIGPLSLLYLGKIKFGLHHKLDLLPKLLLSYKKILNKLKNIGIKLVQIDEPILTLELDSLWINAFKKTYNILSTIPINILLTTYFDTINKYYKLLFNLPIFGIHIDIVYGSSQLNDFLNFYPSNKVLSIGVIDGKNIWCCDLDSTILKIKNLYEKLNNKLWISSSCSFLHIPLDLNNEHLIDNEIKSWLAFAVQKLYEIFTIKETLFGSFKKVEKKFIISRSSIKSKKNSKKIHNYNVKNNIKNIKKFNVNRSLSFLKRKNIQKKYYNFPKFITTTIGSFPQTKEIRKIRSNFKKNKIKYIEYIENIKNKINIIIKKQENLGLDVLVHGEPERNDMVEYFSKKLLGFIFTSNGWVQSYGSRCVKPPIIYGDIYRPKAMTIFWSKFAQSLTKKPVKGMLTGPVTMLLWSFVRNDQEKKITALQIALALKDEVKDLEKSGINIIQIDEPAFREGLPLKKSNWNHYLKWAVLAFKISSSSIQNKTQIHTHMCYSEFNDILKWISNMDADVITIETAKSNMKLLDSFNSFNYPNDIGPGVYDIHSPRIPKINEISNLIYKAQNFISKDCLWINPDCGLKTRTWKEISYSLKNMIKSTKILRKSKIFNKNFNYL